MISSCINLPYPPITPKKILYPTALLKKQVEKQDPDLIVYTDTSTRRHEPEHQPTQNIQRASIQPPKSPAVKKLSKDQESPTDQRIRITNIQNLLKIKPVMTISTYAGIQVFELVLGDISVMRRVDNNFVNATHILKVAGFSKTKRTRILDLIQCERIQGGYGRFQGSWVSLQFAIGFAKKYQVHEVLKDIFNLELTT